MLSSAPRQAYLAKLLGFDVPEFVHVPLVLNDAGKRLSKRDGAVTLRVEGGLTAPELHARLATVQVPGASLVVGEVSSHVVHVSLQASTPVSPP